ncbi:hypothetical protein [Siccirubricoccus sp. G192]|uniref:hypothetical protein n=1 Tax=Siccirubricoccus sp. G192 TaxID=2849651 RepID=UPI0020C4D364|nr:hypothetical protein [Siccirubricoccus sp. G192]
MVPPAPERFSTTQFWPKTCCSQGASSRALISAVPPGAAGTTIRRVWVGRQVWPRAVRVMRGVAKGRASAARRVTMGTVSSRYGLRRTMPPGWGEGKLGPAGGAGPVRIPEGVPLVDCSRLLFQGQAAGLAAPGELK